CAAQWGVCELRPPPPLGGGAGGGGVEKEGSQGSIFFFCSLLGGGAPLRGRQPALPPLLLLLLFLLLLVPVSFQIIFPDNDAHEFFIAQPGQSPSPYFASYFYDITGAPPCATRPPVDCGRRAQGLRSVQQGACCMWQTASRTQSTQPRSA